MKISNKPTDRFDWTLAFILLLFCIVSLFAIGSADAYYVPKQLQWWFVSIFIIAATMYLEPDQYKKVSWYLYGLGVFILLFLALAPGGKGQIGEIHEGVKRWLNLPVLGRIQPSEFFKTFFILGMARLVSKHHEKYVIKTLQTDFKLLGKMMLVLSAPLLLIANQPDLGTSIVLIAITAAIILVAGISWKIILPVFSIGAVVGGIGLWAMIYAQDFMSEKLNFDPYQFKRIYSWLDPYAYTSNEGFHLISSLNAIGSGGMTGKGVLNREVSVPENHTDFIFSVIGEEYGFIGSSLVIGLFFILIYHLTKIALELKDPFSMYVSTGIIAMITFHVFENIGMTIQVMPITGIPLPFISYGGSSLMSNMLAIGLIFSMKFHHRTYMFGSEDEE